jgi:hypothetical protein
LPKQEHLAVKGKDDGNTSVQKKKARMDCYCSKYTAHVIKKTKAFLSQSTMFEPYYLAPDME